MDNARPLSKVFPLWPVWELVCSLDPKSYASGSMATGRVTQAGVVEG
jgi:hypothetical protein